MAGVPPTVVNVGGTAVGIAAGIIHTCALLSNGDVKCWGNNASGEVGDGTISTRTAPGPRVPLAAPAVAVACGASHTCALLATGAVQCWGDNMLGQLGNGGVPTESPTPVTVVGIP
jgi:alpha-tubulin suppressor-like RCC1 family protein